MGNNPVELGVNLSLFVITADPSYVINNIKIIKKGDGSYITINYAISNFYKTSKVKGLKDEAMREFETALKLKPDFLPAQQAIELLNRESKILSAK